MKSFLESRWQNWRKRQSLPADTYVELIDSLFSTTGSFYSGALTGLIGPVVAYARTQQLVFVYIAAAICLVTAFRIAIMLSYKANRRKARHRIEHWEFLYALGGISFMLLIGWNGAALVAMQADNVSQLFGLIIQLGCLGAVAGRNAARPTIVLGQVLALTLPLCIAFWSIGGGWYMALSALMVPSMVSVLSTTKFLNLHLLKAILSSREEKKQKERFDMALSNMAQGLCMANAAGQLTVVNRRFHELFDVADNLVGTDLAQLPFKIAHENRVQEFEGLTFVASFERFIKHPHPGVFTAVINDHIYDFKCERMTDGGLLIVAEDVTESRTAARKIEHMAMYDSLTGLPNRFHFRNKIQEVADRIVSGSGFSVLYIDLDLFKEVNDTLGHPVGDKLLYQVAQRLKNAVGNDGTVARFGGDEFLVLLETRHSHMKLDELCEKLLKALGEPYQVDENMIIIRASIGTASAPADGRAADDIIKKADMALYSAKSNGRGNFSHFTVAMDEKAHKKRQIETQLRDAIRNNQLDIVYQPIVNSKSGKISACEALVRWRLPDGTSVSPAVFIPIAEETGQIVELGGWVLNRACEDAASWPDHIRVAVNFSPVQFCHGNVVNVVKKALARSGLQANRLEIEVTETTVIQNADATMVIFEKLAGLGVRLSLDDFGSGYSSLSYLNRFPFHKIKIDRSFVRELDDPKSAAVISAVRHLSDILGLSLVVEGVETIDQLIILSAGGNCDIQGFLFSEPKPVQDLIPLFASEPLVPKTKRLEAQALQHSAA